MLRPPEELDTQVFQKQCGVVTGAVRSIDTNRHNFSPHLVARNF